MRFQGSEETVDALRESIINDALVLQRLDLMPSVVAFLVYLCLFGADERLLVDIRVDFDVAVIGQLQGVLATVSRQSLRAWYRCTRPLAVVDDHNVSSVA